LRDRAGTQIDHTFQARALETFRAQTAQRTNRGFDYVQPETDRLYARGQDVAAAEDGAVARERNSSRWRWRSF